MAVASAGPYASLHLAPDRQPRQHPPPLKCGRETVRQKPTGGSNEARTVSCPAFSSTKCVMTGGSGGGGDGGSGFDEMRDLGARVGTIGEWRIAGGGSVLPFNDAVSKSHCTSTSSAYT